MNFLTVCVFQALLAAAVIPAAAPVVATAVGPAEGLGQL